MNGWGQVLLIKLSLDGWGRCGSNADRTRDPVTVRNAGWFMLGRWERQVSWPADSWLSRDCFNRFWLPLPLE